MQAQICPRCKFRLTSAKAICNTCGYALQSGRRASEPAAETKAAYKPVANNTSTPLTSNTAAPAVKSNPAVTSPGTSSLRQAQANSSSGGVGSFWRTFFGLDPLPSEKADQR